MLYRPPKVVRNEVLTHLVSFINIINHRIQPSQKTGLKHAHLISFFYTLSGLWKMKLNERVLGQFFVKAEFGG